MCFGSFMLCWYQTGFFVLLPSFGETVPKAASHSSSWSGTSVVAHSRFDMCIPKDILHAIVLRSDCPSCTLWSKLLTPDHRTYMLLLNIIFQILPL